MEVRMDIWEKLYLKAKEQYHPEDVSPFIYAHHVVCAIEAENGEIYTGFCIEGCSGVIALCAERVAALNMYVNSGQKIIKRMMNVISDFFHNIVGICIVINFINILFRDKATFRKIR